MAFRFKKSGCVVAGTFNIYVVQPSLLVQLGIIPEDERKTQLYVNLRQPSLKFTAEAMPGVNWTVSTEHLIAETDSPDVNCGNIMASVLDALKYTPLRGIGTNLYLNADAKELTSAAIRKVFPDLPEIRGGETSQRTVHAAIKRDGAIFNIQASTTKAGIELLLNVHTELTEVPKLSDANQVAVEVARNFQARTEEAVNIARELFGVEINHGGNNAD